MKVPADTIGRMAIRLGRALDQSWAKGVPDKSVWNWATAIEAIDASKAQRKPVYDETSINSENGSTTWTFAPDILEVLFYDKGKDGWAGFVRADADDVTPFIQVRLNHWRRMDPNNIWRVDRAITSLACARWQPLYSLTPLSVLTEVLRGKIPSCTVNLYYVISEGEPAIHFAGQWANEEQRAECAAFDKALQAFGKKGGFAKWSQMKISPKASRA